MLPTIKRITTFLKCRFVLPLLLLGVAGHGRMATAQSPDTFTATGNLIEGRFYHTATLLTNGKVLIAGGYSSTPRIDAFGGALASAELYDPSTGTFAATGNMTTHRARHTATLLPNGKVLIAGGGSSSAELYDPSTGTFTGTGSMSTARWAGTATLLNDGKVLIAGGSDARDAADNTLKSAELYDPSAGTFTATGIMTIRRSPTVATLLSGGSVLVDGSVDGGVAELYDPAAGSFALAGVRGGVSDDFPVTSSLLPNGKVLETMGHILDCSNGTELYDPLTGTFTAGQMTAVRGGQTATPLPDATVLIAGFVCIGTSANTELYNPATGTFSPAGEMVPARGDHTASLLPDGTVLIAGGRDATLSNQAGTSAEIYHPAVLIPSPVLLPVSVASDQGAILHASTEELVAPDNAAVAGEALEIYGTGLIDGGTIPPHVTIGGRMAEILFFGKAPECAGLNQVNVRVPSGVAPGAAVPVRLNYLGRSSNEVTIGVQ